MACIATMQHDHSVHISAVFLGETPFPEMCQTFREAVTMADNVQLPLLLVKELGVIFVPWTA